MGQLIQFEECALARLRERLGLVEEANQDLIAFARGHSGAVASIHAAALAVVEAPSLDALLRVVAREWPAILGVDSSALALSVGKSGFRAHWAGIDRVEPAFVDRMLAGAAALEVRSVAHGHPLFGSRAGAIRAEAVIRIGTPTRCPFGLIVLGQEAELEVGSGHGSELLLFLGQIVAAGIGRSLSS